MTDKYLHEVVVNYILVLKCIRLFIGQSQLASVALTSFNMTFLFYPKTNIAPLKASLCNKL